VGVGSQRASVEQQGEALLLARGGAVEAEVKPDTGLTTMGSLMLESDPKEFLVNLHDFT